MLQREHLPVPFPCALLAEPVCSSIEIRQLFSGTAATQDGVAMRESSEALNNATVAVPPLNDPVQIGFPHGSGVTADSVDKLDPSRLHIKGLRMVVGVIEEYPARYRQCSVDS